MCMSGFEKGEQVKRLPCLHVFHAGECCVDCSSHLQVVGLMALFFSQSASTTGSKSMPHAPSTKHLFSESEGEEDIDFSVVVYTLCSSGSVGHS